MRKEQDWKKKGGRLTVRDAGGVGVSIDLGCGDRPPWTAESQYASVGGSQWQIVVAERLPTRGRQGFKCSRLSRTGTGLGTLCAKT